MAAASQVEPPTAKPKRFYDAKPKADADATPPKRGEGTSRSRRTATDPRRNIESHRAGELVDRPKPARRAPKLGAGKSGAGKPRRPRTRK